jgi:hypothetical protein
MRCEDEHEEEGKDMEGEYNDKVVLIVLIHALYKNF